MSIAKTAIKGASWLALFRAISQIISWGATIIVTRLLVPADYGIMEMATMITGYVVLISEMGFGAAIVQRKEISRQELSSAFWFLLFWGAILGGLCFILAYPTAAIFNTAETIPITQAIGLVYLSSVLMIVPRNILMRDLRFKALGFYEGSAIVISCLVMVLMAWSGAGVWTLVGGHIIREALKFLFFFSACKWRPVLHYNFKDVRSLLGFGISIAVGNSLDYVTTKSDRFFCGRHLGEQNLGLYAIGLQFAQMANEKIVSIINSVAFPVLSKFQESPDKTKVFFIRLVQTIAFITAPIFFGLAIVGKDFIGVLLGEKWLGAVIPLQILCIAQFLVAITCPMSPLNIANGRPRWTMNVNIVAAILMPISFYISSKFGLNYVALPWIIIAPLYRIIYVFKTLKESGIGFDEYLRALWHPLSATIVMLSAVMLYKLVFSQYVNNQLINIGIEILGGVLGYGAYLLIIRKQIVSNIREVWQV